MQSGQSISCHILLSRPVADFIIVSLQLGQPFLLAWRGDSLLQQVFQAYVICLDHEMPSNQIGVITPAYDQ